MSTCIARLLAPAALLIASIGTAGASTVPVSVTGFLTTGTGVINIPFEIDVSGTYKARIDDIGTIGLPGPFDSLLLAVSAFDPLEDMGIAGVGTLIPGGGKSATFTFFGEAGRNYIANIAGVPGMLGIGRFSSQIKLVPIPAAGVMFLSALLGLGVVARRRQRSAHAS